MSIIYSNYKTKEKLTVPEVKQRNMFFYNSLTCERHLIKDVCRKDIKHILQTILESNRYYFVVGYDIADIEKKLVLGKVELVEILLEYEFTYKIAYMELEDHVLALELTFDRGVQQFKDSKVIDLHVSYDELSKMTLNMKLDDNMTPIWEEIKHWWEQKEIFKELD